jgi:hypothetical protein
MVVDERQNDLQSGSILIGFSPSPAAGARAV